MASLATPTVREDSDINQTSNDVNAGLTEVPVSFLVVLTAMVGNMVIAGTAGLLVPVALKAEPFPAPEEHVRALFGESATAGDEAA